MRWIWRPWPKTKIANCLFDWTPMMPKRFDSLKDVRRVRMPCGRNYFIWSLALCSLHLWAKLPSMGERTNNLYLFIVVVVEFHRIVKVIVTLCGWPPAAAIRILSVVNSIFVCFQNSRSTAPASHNHISLIFFFLRTRILCRLILCCQRVH